MTKTRRQLIFLWTYREWGGAQIYLIAIMKAARPDWDITVVIPKQSSTEIIQYLKNVGVTIEFLNTYIDLDDAPTIRRKLSRQWSRIRSEILSLKYLSQFNLGEGILHIETSPWQSWIFLTLLSLRGANVFVTLHNAPTAPSNWRRSIWRVRMRFLSKLRGFHIFTSNIDTKDRIRDLVTDRFWDRIAVTYTCVDPLQIGSVLERPFEMVAVRKRHEIMPDAFVVLCVGQFIDRKGRWVFLEAAKQVVAADPSVVFVWLTPTMPNDETTEKISEYELDQNFRLILSANVGSRREEVLSFFQIADVFALPSFIEGLPIALLEAMALGLPAISTRVYAIPEAIEDRETGILIKAGDSDALAGSILEIRADEDLRKTMASNGQNFVLKHFDEREASRIAIEEYEGCFADGR